MNAIIIPARSGSRRFPRKHLQPLGDTTVIGMLIDRAKEVGSPVIVATTWLDDDADLRAEAERHGAVAWPGHPTDLLERYLELCLTFDIDAYLDISGDCPFFDQAQAERIWYAMANSDYDFDTYSEEPAFAPNDTAVGGKSIRYLEKWADKIDQVPEERREQYWTAVDPPEFESLVLTHVGDRTTTPIKVSIDWPMDLAIANVIYDTLGGRAPKFAGDLEYVWSKVRRLRSE